MPFNYITPGGLIALPVSGGTATINPKNGVVTLTSNSGATATVNLEDISSSSYTLSAGPISMTLSANGNSTISVKDGLLSASVGYTDEIGVTSASIALGYAKGSTSLGASIGLTETDGAWTGTAQMGLTVPSTVGSFSIPGATWVNDTLSAKTTFNPSTQDPCTLLPTMFSTACSILQGGAQTGTINVNAQKALQELGLSGETFTPLTDGAGNSVLIGSNGTIVSMNSSGSGSVFSAAANGQGQLYSDFNTSGAITDSYIAGTNVAENTSSAPITIETSNSVFNLYGTGNTVGTSSGVSGVTLACYANSNSLTGSGDTFDIRANGAVATVYGSNNYVGSATNSTGDTFANYGTNTVMVSNANSDTLDMRVNGVVATVDGNNNLVGSATNSTGDTIVDYGNNTDLIANANSDIVDMRSNGTSVIVGGANDLVGSANGATLNTITDYGSNTTLIANANHDTLDIGNANLTANIQGSNDIIGQATSDKINDSGANLTLDAGDTKDVVDLTAANSTLNVDGGGNIIADAAANTTIDTVSHDTIDVDPNVGKITINEAAAGADSIKGGADDTVVADISTGQSDVISWNNNDTEVTKIYSGEGGTGSFLGYGSGYNVGGYTGDYGGYGSSGPSKIMATKGADIASIAHIEARPSDEGTTKLSWQQIYGIDNTDSTDISSPYALSSNNSESSSASAHQLIQAMASFKVESGAADTSIAPAALLTNNAPLAVQTHAYQLRH
jgi:hypothetical protein